MSDLLSRFAQAVARNPDGIAIIDGGGRQTRFRDLDARTRQLAARWYAKGIRPGDRVLLAMGLTADLYTSLAALWSLGATVVLPEPAMGIAGLRHAARTTHPRAFCASGWFAALKFLVPELWSLPLLRPGVAQGDAPTIPVKDTDVALISFTSGTTGAPKAIPRSHDFLMAQFDAVAPLLASNTQERDLVTFPVFTLINLAEGRTSVLPNWKMSRAARLTPAHLGAWLADQKITRVLVPPSLCDLLLRTDVPDRLHTILTGGGPVFPDLVATLRERTGARIVCVYGSTEAEPIAHLDAADIGTADMQDMTDGRGLLVGPPVPQIKVRIVDHEVQVAGRHVNDGYLDPTRNAENKVVEGDVTWHRTGDAGLFDDRDRLWLLGRVGSAVNTPSGTIFPFAIEVAARQWTGVEHSALMPGSDAPVLVVQGDATHLPQWQGHASGFGVATVLCIDKIPMDRRHNSKVDRARLTKLIAGRGGT